MWARVRDPFPPNAEPPTVVTESGMASSLIPVLLKANSPMEAKPSLRPTWARFGVSANAP